MRKIRQNIYTVCFAVILALICAVLLTVAAEFTRPRQLENKKAEEIRNILTALKVPFEPEAASGKLIEIFQRDVTEQTEDGLTLYLYKPNGAEDVQAVAVKFAGPGLWGPVKGILALEPDYQTIRGVTFYEQEETPGLGGEITTDGFRSQFEGKQIVDDQNQWDIDIVPSGTEATGINEVAGISGATMTCDKVEEMIDEIIRALAANRSSDVN